MTAALLSMLDADLPIEERVAVVAPILNQQIDDFGKGDSTEGVQVFQEGLLKLIESAHLSDKRWVAVDKVGVHPSNREGAGLVPIDVHDLLLRICLQGWSWKAVDALACEIPPTPEGAKWRDFNKKLIESSDGLLASTNPDSMELLTIRGSHTTACVRAYAVGCKGVHDDLSVDGMVSQSAILARESSMAEPLKKGIEYLTLKWQAGWRSPVSPLVLPSVWCGAWRFSDVLAVVLKLCLRSGPIRRRWQRIFYKPTPTSGNI